MKQLNQRLLSLDMPNRIRRLPLSREGYPVPWFVAEIKGEYDFRVFDRVKLAIAIKHRRCWQCGEPLGVHLCFPIGPMCCVNRTNTEPPSHYDCSVFAAQACPFLTQPRMRRNEKNLPEDKQTAGIAILRNPGVVALWITRDYTYEVEKTGGVLFKIGNPERVEFYAEGRKATRAEVLHSITTGLPKLQAVAESEGPDAVAELKQLVANAMKLLPPEPEHHDSTEQHAL